jgi:alpha-tubulin suppressor-like RCC1 family protein
MGCYTSIFASNTDSAGLFLGIQNGGTITGCGDNQFSEVSGPKNITGAIQVSAGNNYGLALLNNGKVTGWGNNSLGEATPPIDLTEVSGISAGLNHSMAILKNGRVTGWGYNNLGQTTPPVGIGTGAAQVFAANSTSLVLLKNGKVTGFGYNYNPAFTNSLFPPAGIINSTVNNLSVSEDAALAILTNGKVTGWGNNNLGQLSVPTGIGTNAIQISLGKSHSLAILKDGTVTGWGNNTYGQITIPNEIQKNITGISAGWYFSVALLKDNTATGWGLNVFQQASIPKCNQTITFPSISNKVVGDIFTLGAAASTNFPIAYTANNSNIITINGNTATIIGAGNSDVTANQIGNNYYAAAPAVTRNIIANTGTQTITFPVISNKAFGDPNFYLGATASSNLPLTYTSSDTGVATIDSNGLVSIVGTGNSNITTYQTGNINYYPATSVTRNLTINKGDSIITFPSIPVKIFEDASFNLGVISNNNFVPIVYSSSNTGVATVNSSGIVSIIGVGNSNIIVNQTGSNYYNSAAPVTRNLIVNRKNQIINFPEIPAKFWGDTFNLGVTSNNNSIPIIYTSRNTGVATVDANGTVTTVGIGSSDIIASQVENANYNPGVYIRNLVVNKKNQIISIPFLRYKNFNDAPFNINATSDNNSIPITYTSNNTNVATVNSNGLVTLVGNGGSFAITASQVGNDYYNSTSTTQIITVSKLNQNINYSKFFQTRKIKGNFSNYSLGSPCESNFGEIGICMNGIGDIFATTEASNYLESNSSSALKIFDLADKDNIRIIQEITGNYYDYEFSPNYYKKPCIAMSYNGEVIAALTTKYNGFLTGRHGSIVSIYTGTNLKWNLATRVTGSAWTSNRGNDLLRATAITMNDAGTVIAFNEVSGAFVGTYTLSGSGSNYNLIGNAGNISTSFPSILNTNIALNDTGNMLVTANSDNSQISTYMLSNSNWNLSDTKMMMGTIPNSNLNYSTVPGMGMCLNKLGDTLMHPISTSGYATYVDGVAIYKRIGQNWNLTKILTGFSGALAGSEPSMVINRNGNVALLIEANLRKTSSLVITGSGSNWEAPQLISGKDSKTGDVHGYFSAINSIGDTALVFSERSCYRGIQRPYETGSRFYLFENLESDRPPSNAIIKNPSTTKIATGQKILLSSFENAVLDSPGIFSWSTPEVTNYTPGIYNYTAQFVPFDNLYYNNQLIDLDVNFSETGAISMRYEAYIFDYNKRTLPIVPPSTGWITNYPQASDINNQGDVMIVGGVKNDDRKRNSWGYIDVYTGKFKDKKLVATFDAPYRNPGTFDQGWGNSIAIHENTIITLSERTTGQNILKLNDPTYVIPQGGGIYAPLDDTSLRYSPESGFNYSAVVITGTGSDWKVASHFDSWRNNPFAREMRFSKDGRNLFVDEYAFYLQVYTGYGVNWKQAGRISGDLLIKPYNGEPYPKQLTSWDISADGKTVALTYGLGVTDTSAVVIVTGSNGQWKQAQILSGRNIYSTEELYWTNLSARGQNYIDYADIGYPGGLAMNGAGNAIFFTLNKEVTGWEDYSSRIRRIGILTGSGANWKFKNYLPNKQTSIDDTVPFREELYQYENTTKYITTNSDNIQKLVSNYDGTIVAGQWGSGVFVYTGKKDFSEYNKVVSHTLKYDTGILGIKGSKANGLRPLGGFQYPNVTMSDTGNLICFGFYKTPFNDFEGQIVLLHSKMPQSVFLPALTGKNYGETFCLSGYSDSNLPLTYNIDNGSIINKSCVAFNNTGNAKINAYANGDDYYLPGYSFQAFIVNKGNQNLNLNNLEKLYSDRSFNLDLNTEQNAIVTYSGNNPIVATINGNLVNISSTGSMLIFASQPGNEYLYPFTGVIALNVSKGNQIITFPNILDKILSDLYFTPKATVTSQLPINYTTFDSGFISINNNLPLVTLKAVGSPTITANQTGNEFYNAADSVSRTFNITPLPFVSENDFNLNFKYGSLIKNLNYNIELSGSPLISRNFDINNNEPFYIGLQKDHLYIINAKSNEKFFEFGNVTGTKVLSSNTYTNSANLNIDFSDNEPELNISTQVNDFLALVYKLDDIITPSGVESVNENDLKAFTIDYKTYITGEVLDEKQIPSLNYKKYELENYCAPKQVIIQPTPAAEEDPCTIDFSCAICSSALKTRSNNPSQTFIDIPQIKMPYRIYGNLVDYIFTNANPGYYRIALNDKLFSLCCKCQDGVDCKKELGVGDAGGGVDAAFIECKQDNLFDRPKDVDENTINQQYGLYFLDAITLKSISTNYGPYAYYSGEINNVNSFAEGDKITFNQYSYPFEKVYADIYLSNPTYKPVNAEFIYSSTNTGDKYFYTTSQLVDRINSVYYSSGIYTWLPMLYSEKPYYSYGPMLFAELKDESTISLISLKSGRLGEHQILLTYAPRPNSMINTYLVPKTIELQGSDDGITWNKIVSSQDVQPVNVLSTSYTQVGGNINYEAINNTTVTREITVPISATTGNRIVPSGTTTTSGDLSNLIDQIESGNKQFATGNGATIVCVPTAGKFSKICGSGYIELWIPSGCPVPDLKPKESGAKEADAEGDVTEENTDKKTILVEESVFRLGFTDYR